jgi:SAM-dependent methyltransferase
MEIEQAYHALVPFFDLWVRMVEMDTRKREALEQASRPPQRALIISPPTDAGIKLLADANRGGATTLLCFSSRLRDVADAYQRARMDVSTEFAVASFFENGFGDGAFTTVYANCFLDFCQGEELVSAVKEIHRILAPGGKLYAAYMDFPRNAAGRIWSWLADTFKTLSGGCHPVSIERALSDAGFVVEKDDRLEKFGFPLRYTVAVAR